MEYPIDFNLFAGKIPFGEKSVSSLEPAKAIIFPEQTESLDVANDLYKRSHGSYGPGEQRSRNYQWRIDPEQTRFGRKGDTIALNGTSQNVMDVLKPAPSNTAAVNSKKVFMTIGTFVD